MTWNKNGGQLVQDVPHILIRRSVNSNASNTILMLTIDTVVHSDAGMYQCTAQDGQEIANGNIIPITGKSILTQLLCSNTLLI